jgi:phage repressor protein C with HTH and peptisase S24 domain
MIGNRIKEARNHKGFSQELLSEKIGVSKRTLINYEQNDKEPTASTILNIAKYCTISEWWLLTGKGEMLLKENNLVASNNNYNIDLLNVRAGAGEGIYNYVIETIDTISLDKSFFRTPINTSKVKGIQVDGDSMEPTLKDGDYVLIDENINFGTNGIYAIQYGGQILIKRLQFKIDGTILILSDNDKYEKETFNPNENQLPFQVLGIKVLSIQK